MIFTKTLKKMLKQDLAHQIMNSNYKLDRPLPKEKK